MKDQALARSPGIPGIFTGNVGVIDTIITALNSPPGCLAVGARVMQTQAGNAFTGFANTHSLRPQKYYFAPHYGNISFLWKAIEAQEAVGVFLGRTEALAHAWK